MKKVWIIVIISIVLLAIGGITGIYIYNINNTLNQNSIKAKELADELKRKMIEEENRTVSTSSNTVKTSPNSIVQKNTVYKICNHTVQKTEIIPEELINKEEKDIEQYYKDWQIKKFTSSEIVLYMEKDEYCDRHYVLKENNGVIAIYKVNQEKEAVFKENTQIQVQYLPEVDLINLKKGIYAIGEEKLNSILEDFE